MDRDNIRGAFYIALKDIRAYYFKPPNISWGVMFPAGFALAFYLRSPGDMTGVMPGLVAMTALFSATSMAAIVITFERRIGALERLALAPLSPGAILAGKVVGGATFGLAVSAMVLLALVAARMVHLAAVPLALVVLGVSSLAFSALGALVSVAVREVFEAQTLANLFRFPMIFLSGVFMPVEELPPVLSHLAGLLPLTYSVSALDATFSLAAGPPVLLDMLVLLGFGALPGGLAARILGRRLSA